MRMMMENDLRKKVTKVFFKCALRPSSVEILGPGIISFSAFKKLDHMSLIIQVAISYQECS